MLPAKLLFQSFSGRASYRFNFLLGRWAVGFSLVLLLNYTPAQASGPRYVTGPPFFTGPAGAPIGWRQPTLLYSTDPAGLSASVNHQAADALVAAAASVWNLPVASITIGQGGSLAEHVSGQNTYLGPSGLVFPADVLSSNASSIPIAVIYDTDGSVTDTLLGSGASAPANCRQGSVTESVDAFDPAGYILHAIIILNGRCTGTAPELQLDMRYKLERIFGRVLGLAWSQTNDNVFTGSPTPTYNQALNWPIMHPIDIICGPYSYQCLPSPFQLRPDDVAGMVNLYPVSASSAVPSGKQVSLTAALGAQGHVTFPTGEGMAGVNVLIRREAAGSGPDGWFENSAVTGSAFRRADVSPFVEAQTTPLASLGTTDPAYQGFYSIAYIPIESSGSTPWQNLITSFEPVNPLYIGAYSLGPYAPGIVSPSGSAPQPVTTYVDPPGGEQVLNFAVTDAAFACGNGADGTASAPVQVPSTGWWNGLLCGYGHASYLAANVHPNRSFTIEVTALDAQGLATESKAMPVVAVFSPTDAAGAVPSVGVTPAAFDAITFATTTLHAQTGQLTSVRIGIADQRGDGRPDFNFQARLFYADTVTPAALSSSGGILTITGFGFRPGNAVAINGVSAAVVSYTANTLVVSAPPIAAANATAGVPVDIALTDLGTGASSTLYAALTYSGSALPNSMRILTVQAGSVFVGDAAPVPFAIQVVAADGVTPISGDAISFTSNGNADFAGCQPSNSSNACTLSTDSRGVASTIVTPLRPGAVNVQAADATLSQSASFTATAQPGSIAVFAAPSGNLPVGVVAQPYFFVRVFNPQGASIAGVPVTFTVPIGSATFSGCFTSTCTVTADANGVAFVFITPTAPGPVTIQAAVGDVHQQISFTAVANVETLQTLIAPNASAFNNESAGEFQVRLLNGDGSPGYLQPVIFTAPAAVTIDQCGASTCTVTTDWAGQAAVTLTPHQLGTFTVHAASGAATQSASFHVIDHTWQLSIISAPSGTFPVGAPLATPFTVQVLLDGVTPVGGLAIALAGPAQQVLLTACNSSGCLLYTDANGMASTTVTPLQAGTISLSGTLAPYNVTASFVASGQPETMRIVLQPAPTGELIGDLAEFETQLIGADGDSPVSNQTVIYSVLSGPFALLTCSYASCSGQSDTNGMNFVYGEVTGAGTITVQAVSGNLSQTFTFTSTARPDTMRLVTAPASGGYTGVPAAVPFAIQVLAGDGVSFASGRSIALSVNSGSATFAGCAGASTCTLTTDASGNLSTLVTPTAAGTITIAAAEAASPAIAQIVTFTALTRPDTLRLVSSPLSGASVGSPATTPFSIQLLLGDGTTPKPNSSVTLSVSTGSATFAACAGASTCTLQTNASGNLSTTVTPTVAGTITLTATETSTPAITLTATFNALNAVPAADVLSVLSSPGASVFVGDLSATSFTVRLTLSDGVTPVGGVAINFTSAGSGSARFAACGASPCTVVTASDGTASTQVGGVAPGTLTLSATASSSSRAQPVSTLFQIVANQYSVTALPAQTWIAEGATLSLPLSVSASRNGSLAAQQPLHWTGSAGFIPGATDTLTSANGAASLAATVGPLPASASASGTVCAWITTCQSFTVQAVPSQDYHVTIVSGGQQSIQGGQSLAPLIVLITDSASHPIVSAPVTINQTLTAFNQACPTHGRCPAAPILTSQALAVISGIDGSVSITPLALPGTATETEISISSGSQGFATAVLESNP